MYGGPVLIKFSTEASLELCDKGGGKYVNGLPWIQRLLIKDAAGRCPSNFAATAKKGNSGIVQMLDKRKHFFRGTQVL